MGVEWLVIHSCEEKHFPKLGSEGCDCRSVCTAMLLYCCDVHWPLLLHERVPVFQEKLGKTILVDPLGNHHPGEPEILGLGGIHGG